MESKTSIHSSREEEVVAGQEYYNEKKANGSFYDDEDVVGSKDDHLDEDSPIEEVRAVVPK